MRRIKNLFWAPVLVLTLTAVLGVPRVLSQYPAGGPKLRGSVRTADGKPLEGATVSIRGEGKTFVTTVFTNQKGVFVFPPVQSGLKYSLWAQAQGFQTARLDVNATSGQVQQVAALQLKPLENFEKQLTGVEWMNSFPERTAADKREKQIFASNCSGCHDNHFALQNRFDADGWNKIVTVMSMSSEGVPVPPNATGQQAINAYKDEIVAFLAKVRGPNPRDYDLKPLPRPTGEAAQVVITEFEMPRAEAPAESYVHNGSDWMEGTPSRWQGRAAHDATIASDGNIYFSDDRGSDRTISKLNPRTGETALYTLAAKNGGVAGTHSVATDPDGNVWADNQATGDLLMFDVRTQQFKDFARPAGTPTAGGTILVRAVDPPDGPVPPRMTLVLDRGPYTIEGESALMREHGVGLLVTKNSGGPMTAAKLEAARDLGVQVLMVRRPPLPEGTMIGHHGGRRRAVDQPGYRRGVITRAGPLPVRITRVWLEPTMSRQRMSTCSGSSSPSVVTVTSWSGVPTARPTTTGVSGSRCASSRSRASVSCWRRDLEAGL